MQFKIYYSLMMRIKIGKNKVTIKKVIEYVFDVNVTNVNTLMSPKKKRTVGRFSGYLSQYKKAIVTLKDGDKINLFPDM